MEQTRPNWLLDCPVTLSRPVVVVVHGLIVITTNLPRHSPCSLNDIVIVSSNNKLRSFTSIHCTQQTVHCAGLLSIVLCCTRLCLYVLVDLSSVS
jgi:hypothetical protein